MRTISFGLLLGLTLLAFFNAPAGAGTAMIMATVSESQVTAVRSVDEGFKTFSNAVPGLPINLSFTTIGDSAMFDAFLLYTDEEKVNQEEPNPTGDLTPFAITATVTFTAPVMTLLTFTGTTVGQEDFSGVPGVDPVTGQVTNQALLFLWAQTATDEQISLAGGRGIVQWDGPQFVDLGGGQMLRVTLENAFFNDAVNFPALLGIRGFGGPGPANGETIQGTVELIPEPGSALLCLLSFGAFLFFRRERRD